VCASSIGPYVRQLPRSESRILPLQGSYPLRKIWKWKKLSILPFSWIPNIKIWPILFNIFEIWGFKTLITLFFPSLLHIACYPPLFPLFVQRIQSRKCMDLHGFFNKGGWSSHPADLLLPPSPPFISSPPFNSHHLRLRLSDSPPFLVSSRHETSSRGHLQQCQCLEGSVQTALDAILFTQTCSMTRCVELPTSIWSSLMLWTRLGVREVRWRIPLDSSLDLLYYFPIFTVYLRLHTGGPTGLFNCSHQDPPSIYDCQRTCRAQSSSITRPPLWDCHGTSFSDHNLRSACCKPKPTNECGTQAVVACAKSTSWYTCNTNSRACCCLCTRTPIRCCYHRACHKPPTNIINASGTKRLWNN
jgi:hypothetical protein